MELREVAPNDPRETLRRASRLVSRRVGIIKGVGHGVLRAQDPPIFSLGVIPSELSLNPQIANPLNMGGAGETLEAALASTIGETVERYCTLFYDKQRMVRGSFRELGDLAVSPERLRLFSRQQVEARSTGRLAYFDEDSRIHWAWGWSLTEDRPRLVPAGFVYLSYRADPDEPAIGSNASTGLAAGLTLEAAALSALYEVVERDSFALSWLRRHARCKLRIDDPGLQEKLRTSFAVDRPDVSVQFFDLTTDLQIPTVFVVLRRPAEFGPALCVAASSRLNPRDAARKCLLELGQALPYVRSLLPRFKSWAPKDDFSDLTSFDHHMMIYVKRPELISRAMAFYDEIGGEAPLSSLADHSTGRIKGDLERCIGLLRQAGYEVIVADVTTPDIREAGFRVVRVLVPGLVPLHGDHNFPYLGVSRLYEPPGGAQMNPLPHPFS